MNEKRVPSFALAAIKQAFSAPESLNRTFTAVEGAEHLGMADADVAAVVQSLSKADFVKSMTSYANNKIWQDVYRPLYKGTRLYIKFTINAHNELLLISFKEA